MDKDWLLHGPGIAALGAIGAAAYAPYAAPAGYRWEFVTYLGERVSYLNQPVVALTRIT